MIPAGRAYHEGEDYSSGGPLGVLGALFILLVPLLMLLAVLFQYGLEHH